MPPKASTAAAAIASMSAMTETSVGTKMALPPAFLRASVVAAPTSRSMSATTTEAPRATKASAQALPIPIAAPVTMATRPSNSRSLMVSSL